MKTQRLNKKREALREALGNGARLFDDGEVMGVAVIKYPSGRQEVLVFQVDGEHDGSFAISQVGGVITAADILAKSTRGPAIARGKIR